MYLSNKNRGCRAGLDESVIDWQVMKLESWLRTWSGKVCQPRLGLAEVTGGFGEKKGEALACILKFRL